MPRRRPLPRAGHSRADLHIHTHHSDGTASPVEVLERFAREPEFRVLAITDHDTIDGALEARALVHGRSRFPNLEVIVGEEVSSRDGHVLGLFLERRVPPGLNARETIDEIHAQGGLAIAAHPYTSWLRWRGLLGVGDLIETLPFDAIETKNSNFTEFFANRKAARRAGDRARVGCSDGHFLDAVGRCYTDFPGETAEDLRRAIIARTTVPGGGCYGALTLARFVLGRIWTGRSVFPTRREAAGVTAQDGCGDAIAIERLDAADAVIVHVSGTFDAGTVVELAAPIEGFLREGLGVLLDLESVATFSAAGSRGVAEWDSQARELGVELIVARRDTALEDALGKSERVENRLRTLPLSDARRTMAEKAADRSAEEAAATSL